MTTNDPVEHDANLTNIDKIILSMEYFTRYGAAAIGEMIIGVPLKSRQAYALVAGRFISKLVDDGLLESRGRTHGYYLTPIGYMRKVELENIWLPDQPVKMDIIGTRRYMFCPVCNIDQGMIKSEAGYSCQNCNNIAILN